MKTRAAEGVQVHAPRSYVLRCVPVRTGQGEAITWRLSLQEAAPDAPKHAFTCLAELMAFLGADLDRAGSTSDRADAGDAGGARR